ncbi:hypothetical protein CASFOL_009698 [Castilleja foliolosa]|uniref:Uncharacterized protein n=1 Tax=Castilleja foliolosa TaxID=1961234 RepID=A0ABD3DQE6_9LAMI
MQTIVEEKLVLDFHSQLKLEDNLHDDDLRLDDDDVMENEEDEFSFNCGELSTSSIAAEDVFINGQMKPVFPLFNRVLSFSGEDLFSLQENLPTKPPVKNIFVETNVQATTSSGSGGDEIVGPYCEWSSRKTVEASSDQVCKKSNSTGFSKIFRIRERVGRSNSDGKDAFVFLNNGGGHAAAPAEEKAVKIKKSSKTTSLSAHEVYLRSKAQSDERLRRSYLPYRPDLVGFFTNVNVGLTKNVHPF